MVDPQRLEAGRGGKDRLQGVWREGAMSNVEFDKRRTASHVKQCFVYHGGGRGYAKVRD